MNARSRCTRQVAPLPLPLPRPLFFAVCGTEVVGWADSLADLLAELDAIHDDGTGEDVAVWEGGRVRCVLTEEGAVIHIARHAIA